MKYSAIVLAAGIGSRMGLGYNKMLYPIHGKPVILHTIEKFMTDPHCSEVLVIVNKTEVEAMTNLIPSNPQINIVEGGAERQYSVYAGLQAVTEDVVLVHDGARPLVERRMMNECCELASKGMASVVGVAVKDTVKRVNEGVVVETLNRDELYSIQTPQAAPTAILKLAHERAREQQFLGTDEASLIERFTDATVRIVQGAYTNIKLTTPEDLVLAEQLLQN